MVSEGDGSEVVGTLVNSTTDDVVPVSVVWNYIWVTEVGVGKVIKGDYLACSSILNTSQ